MKLKYPIKINNSKMQINELSKVWVNSLHCVACLGFFLSVPNNLDFQLNTVLFLKIIFINLQLQRSQLIQNVQRPQT